MDAPSCDPWPEWAWEVAAGPKPRTVALADLNEDGALDVWLTHDDVPQMWIWLGEPGGGLSADPPIVVELEHAGYQVAVADLDDDGVLDAVVSAFESRGMTVILGGGAAGVWDGTFTSTRYAGPDDTRDVALADLGGDGILDVVTAGRDDGLLAVYTGVGDGTFDAPAASAIGVEPFGIGVSDLDGDGDLDAAVSLIGEDAVAVLLNEGGTLVDSGVRVVSNTPYGIALHDLDGDGAADLVVRAADDLEVALGYGDGTFALPTTYDGGVGAGDVVVAHFDDDGLPDVAITAWTNATVRLYAGQPGGLLGMGTEFGAGGGSWGLAAGDVDLDGVLDLAVAGNASNSLALLQSTCP